MTKSNAITQAKRTFFSSKEVQSHVDKETRQVFSKFGAHVRRRARQSIRKRKTASPPGKPPSSHSGKLKRFIFFGYDKTKRSVVVGPVRLTGKNKGDAPELLEYGGAQIRGKNQRRKDRYQGSSGVVAIGKHVAARTAYEAREKTSRNSTSVPYNQVVDWCGKKIWVTFWQLFTDEQVRRSEELETTLWGPKKLGGKVAARPFMWTAAREEVKSLPDKWKYSVK